MWISVELIEDLRDAEQTGNIVVVRVQAIRRGPDGIVTLMVTRDPRDSGIEPP
jgi:hypothetical protein